MPRRKLITRVKSDEVQGEDSWVDIRRMLWKEIKALQKQKKKIDESEDAGFEVGSELILSHIERWNWCDESGVPLPQPEDDPDVFDDLTDEEFSFLADAVAGNEEERKN